MQTLESRLKRLERLEAIVANRVPPPILVIVDEGMTVDDALEVWRAKNGSVPVGATVLTVVFDDSPVGATYK